MVCEHLALSTLSTETKLLAATSRILQAKGRTFLETERFDRHGRSAVVSLAGGEVPTRNFKPDLPLPTEKNEWLIACTAACRFWQTAARDNRVSKAFRAICSANSQALARLLDMI